MKDNALLVIYYPNNNWFLKLKFFHRNNFSNHQTLESNNEMIMETEPINERELHGNIIYADLNKDNKQEKNEPIIAMNVESYKHLINNKNPP